MHHDAIIVGGSFAGLSAAMYLARARRSVCVVDAGAPRNRFAEHSHGFFAQDGSAPGAILDTARAQVAAYPTVTFVEGKVASAEAQGDGFGVRLEDGRMLESERLVLAYGLSDELPEISGLEVTKWLKDDEELNHIPVIAVTAFAMKGDEERIRQGGCEAYISKPISVVSFLETIRKHLG